MPAAAHDNTPRAGTSDGPTGTSDTTAGSMYAFDPRETPIVGKRSHEWIAVGPSELRCLQEMARCLAELREGRWPK